MPRLGNIRIFLISLEYDEFRMSFFLKRLLEGVNLQGAELARERFLLILRDLLIAKNNT